MNLKIITGSNGITVTCHAGAMFTKGNSVSSVKKAVNLEAEIVELDVSFRPDGTPVMIHKEAPAVDEGEYLYKALEIVAKSSTCQINLDLKSTANLPELERLTEEYHLFERVFYTGVGEDWVEEVKTNSAIPYYLNHAITEEEAADKAAAQALADKAKALGAIGINSRFTGGSKLFTDVMHENGLAVSYWTPNNEPDMKKVISYRPDNITTEHPVLLAKLLKKNA